MCRNRILKENTVAVLSFEDRMRDRLKTVSGNGIKNGANITSLRDELAFDWREMAK